MRSVSAALLLLTVLPGCKGTAPEDTRTIEERIEALALDRDPLADDANPIFALKEPLESFLQHTREDFESGADRPTFLDFQVSPATLKRCWTLQQALRDVMDRGPSQIPDPDEFNIYFLMQVRRANAALAAQSLAKENPSGAAFHLAFTFEVADYLLASEPTILPYIFAVYLKQQTFNDLVILYQQAPSQSLLSHITTICKNSPFRPSWLESVLRSEARFAIDICHRLPDWLREQESEFGSLWAGFYEPPLADCTFEQLLALPYDKDASIAREVTDTEDLLAWASGSASLDQLPARLRTRPAPKSLSYYQSASNGLAEILVDCAMGTPLPNALVTHQILDAHMQVVLAWLQAETDGVTVTSLDALVPLYLDRIPADPCDGNPLRCIPDQRLVYSIGTDLRDDRGILEPPPDHEDQSFLDRPFSIPEISR